MLLLAIKAVTYLFEKMKKNKSAKELIAQVLKNGDPENFFISTLFNNLKQGL